MGCVNVGGGLEGVLELVLVDAAPEGERGGAIGLNTRDVIVLERE